MQISSYMKTAIDGRKERNLWEGKIIENIQPIIGG